MRQSHAMKLLRAKGAIQQLDAIALDENRIWGS